MTAGIYPSNYEVTLHRSNTVYVQNQRKRELTVTLYSTLQTTDLWGSKGSLHQFYVKFTYNVHRFILHTYREYLT